MAFAAETVAIVGVGLIGGSIGLSLRERQPEARIVGIGRNAARLRQALELGAITEIATTLEAGVAEAGLIIVCAPVDAIPDLVEQIAAHCPDDAVITDVGSTKQQVVEAVAARLRAEGPTFVGSHPLAGSEKTGVGFADSRLFVGRTVVVTPADTESTDSESTEVSANGTKPSGATVRAQAYVESFWSVLGAKVATMSPAAHDQALASTSHLPHLVAAILAAVTPEETLPLVSTGWLGTTRIAAGDVELWRQILMHNQPSVLRCLEDFEKVVTSFRLALQQHDEAAIVQILADGKQRRDALAD